jgi:large subunit ribosomal protein L18
MKPIGKINSRGKRRFRRHLRVRKKVTGTADRPRLAVFRSLKHIYAQLIDDEKGHTVASACDVEKSLKTTEEGKITSGFAVGKQLGERAKEAGVKKVVFDRAGYPYHGRVKAVADGARDAGLEF